MPLYALAISPLVSYLTGASSAKNIWYADDSGAAGDLQALLEWWQVLVHEGPQFGYFPNSVKTWLVVKPQHLEEAIQAFHGTGVQLTTEGRPYLGIPLGTDAFKEHFTEQKFATWKAELTVLSDAARHQPHAAFAAFTHGVRHKWSYYLRSTECGANQLSALDEAVGSMFLPAITGQPSVARHHCLLLSIPARLGGIGLTLPSCLGKQQREAS